MEFAGSVQERLGQLVDVAIIQDSPYLVTVPRSVEGLRSVLQFAHENDYKVMPLGSGSSFSEDFALARNNVIVVMMTALTGVKESNGFTIEIAAGTQIQKIAANYMGERVTLGGLLADGSSPDSHRLRRELLQRLRSVTLMHGDGRIESYVHGEGGAGQSGTRAALVLGCSGRGAVILSASFRASVEELAFLLENLTTESGAMTPARETCLSRGDVTSWLDPSGLFQW